VSKSGLVSRWALAWHQDQTDSEEEEGEEEEAQNNNQ